MFTYSPVSCTAHTLELPNKDVGLQPVSPQPVSSAVLLDLSAQQQDMLSELLSPKEAPSPVPRSLPHVSPEKVKVPASVSADGAATAAAASTVPVETADEAFSEAGSGADEAFSRAGSGVDETFSRAGSFLEEMKMAVGSLRALDSDAVVLPKPVALGAGAAVGGLIVALLGVQARKNQDSEV